MTDQLKKGQEEVFLPEKQISSEVIVPVLEEGPKKPPFLDVLAKLSPGKGIRTGLDDILHGELGALIVVDSPELRDLLEGGFKINCRFTPQKLAELAKMDGAIVLSEDLKRILFCNVLLVPDSKIPTNETGTRHKAAERTAKQTGSLVIAVSERRKKITLFYEDKRYVLENSENLLRRSIETLNLLETQKEILDDLLKNFNVLEITKLVSVGDVCSMLQRIEVILKMMETMKRYLTELGNQGTLIRMRTRELSRGVEELEEMILRDYSPRPINTKKMLDSIAFEGVLDTDSLSRVLFEASSDTLLNPKGHRFLKKLNLTERELKGLILNFESLPSILEASPEELNKVLRAKSESFKKELDNLREQVLMGKKI